MTGSGEGGDPKEVMKKGILKLLTWCRSHNSNSGPQMELVFSFRDPYRELPLTSQFSRRSTESIADAQGSPTVWVNAGREQHRKHSKPSPLLFLTALDSHRTWQISFSVAALA